ncbi:MAG: hypothetical protein NUV46_02570 [Nanoarchaeota archaeon]|nr:hypothetical protein [Nanoarchaeota archaeon]
MLKVKYLLKAAHLQNRFGSEGSCFGTSVSSNLRRSFNLKSIDESVSFNLGEKYESLVFNKDKGYFSKVIFEDVELANDYHARIIRKFKGLKEHKEKYFRNKVPFSDLETKKIYYILKRF